MTGNPVGPPSSRGKLPMKSLRQRFRDYYSFGGDAVLPPLANAMPPKGIDIAWKGWGLWHGEYLLATLAWETTPRRVLEGCYSANKIRFEAIGDLPSKMFDPVTNCEIGTIDLHLGTQRKQGISDISRILMGSGDTYHLLVTRDFNFYLVDEEDRPLGMSILKSALKREVTFKLMADPSESKIDPRLIAIMIRYCIEKRYLAIHPPG
jgi:hypothetical protein